MFGRHKDKSMLHMLSNDLKAYAIALTRCEDQAEDLVQDILLKIHETGIRPDGIKNLKHYAFRMLRNLHIDKMRKAKLVLNYSDEQSRLLIDSNSPVFGIIETVIVRDAFSQLSEDHREILFLIDVMGFSYDNAAETLGVPRGTIMSRVSRGRSSMIVLLEAKKNNTIPN